MVKGFEIVFDLLEETYGVLEEFDFLPVIVENDDVGVVEHNHS